MQILITGATRGIGKAIAFVFAKDGHELFLTGRDEVALYKIMEELGTQFPAATIKAKAFDISVRENSIALGEWMLSYGVPDVLVNNAGRYEPGGVHDEADGAIEHQLATNLLSAYHLTRTVLPAMMKRRSGHVFNMCSIASLAAYDNGGSYSISKHALYGFSKNLREEMKPYGIKVTSILPGAVMTDSWVNFDNSKKRIMEASDIATMVYAAWSLSPAACVEEILIRPQLGDL